jgi:hypothetical protein
MKAAAAEIFMALLVMIIFSLSLGGVFSSLNTNIFKEYSETLKESMIINSSYNIEFAKMGLQHALKYSLHAAIMQPIWDDGGYYADYWYYFEPVSPIGILDTKFFLEKWTAYFFNFYVNNLTEFYNLNIPRVKPPKLFSEAVPQPFDIGNETCKNIGGNWDSEHRLCDLANVACDEEACIHAGGMWDETGENCLALGRSECVNISGTWWERFKICVCDGLRSSLTRTDSFYNSTTRRCEPITNETCKLFGGEWVNITFPFYDTYCNFPGEVFVSGGISDIDVINARIGTKNKISKSSQAINIFDSLNLSSGTVNTYLLAAESIAQQILDEKLPRIRDTILEVKEQIIRERDFCGKETSETDCNGGCVCGVIAPDRCINEIVRRIKTSLPPDESWCALPAPSGSPLSFKVSGAKPIISYSASCTATCQNCNTTSGTQGKKTNITCYFSNWQIAVELDVNILTAAFHPVNGEFKNLNLGFKIIEGDRGAVGSAPNLDASSPAPKISLTCEGKNFFSATQRKCEKLARFGYNCEWNSTYNLCSCPGGNPC